MRRIFLGIAVVALVWSGFADAQSVQRVLEEFNYIGRWAQDCSKPLSERNSFMNVVVTPSGVVEHRYEWLGGSEVNTIIDARRTGPNEVTLRYRIRDTERTQVIVRKGNLLQTMQLIRPDGSYITKDGIILHAKVPTGIIERCGDNR